MDPLWHAASGRVFSFLCKSRCNVNATAESLELAYKMKRANEDEKKCTGWEFIQKGAKYLKIFSKKCPFDDAVGLLMNSGLFSREAIFLSRSMIVPQR